MTGVSCPNCGVHNHPSASHCDLCRAALREGKPAAAPPIRERRDFYGEQRANIRWSWVLMIAVIGLLALLGWLAGMAWVGHPGGWIVGLIGGAIASLLALYAGDRAVLMASGATVADQE